MINHQSNQLKPRKFYKYWPANANFSKLCDKGHKTKGQILLHLYGSLWTKSSGFLGITVMSSTYCIPRTLESIHPMRIDMFCVTFICLPKREYRKWSTSENDHHRIFRKWSTYEFMLKIKKGMWSTCRFCKKKFKGKWSTYYLNITNVNHVVNHFLKQETWRNTLFMMATSWRFWVTPQCVFVKHVSHSF